MSVHSTAPFNIHVTVALSTVADSSPTPKPRSKDCVASVVVILLQNAYTQTDRQCHRQTGRQTEINEAHMIVKHVDMPESNKNYH